MPYTFPPVERCELLPLHFDCVELLRFHQLETLASSKKLCLAEFCKKIYCLNSIPTQTGLKKLNQIAFEIKGTVLMSIEAEYRHQLESVTTLPGLAIECFKL